MHWWRAAFASKQNSPTDGSGAATFSPKAGFFAALRSRHLTCVAASVRQVADNDDVRNSPARSGSVSPQPLPPPPELLGRSPKFSASGSVPLPAPAKIRIQRVSEEKERDRDRDRDSDSDSVGKRVKWESSIQGNVHPLPLPPGAVMSANSNPVSPLVSRQDISVKPRWQKGKLIGRGTFGSVYVASNRETGALCAMKEVEIVPDDSKSAERLRQLQQEIKVPSHLKHPNIVQYYGSEIIADKFYIYLEYVHPGSIDKFIHDHCGAITESVVRNFTRHILCGLAYLHGTKTIHRDIKGANLLVDAYGVVKLADFGMAKDLHGQRANLSLKGSPYWLAPELLQPSMKTEASYDAAFAVDIWSLGCTIIEMMNGKPPWSECEGAAALFKVLKETPSIPEMMSEEGKDFLQCCFRRNPADRPTASQLLEHPFVSH